MENYELIIGGIGAAYTLASIIIRLTPTVEDDKVFNKLAPWHQRALWLADKIFTASVKKK
uniref:Uncharacterized protein n=1 Tax=viral metagenome TaxID=1070528 RepID=A0A6M3MGY7_9ZZZZ